MANIDQPAETQAGTRSGSGVPGYSREAIIWSLEHNLWIAWSEFGRGPDCALHDEGDALYFDTPVPTLPYNAVLRFAVREEVDARLGAIIGHYRARQVPFMWILHPTALPADLEARLIARGLEEVELVPGMAANLAQLPDPGPVPPGIEIHEVSEETECDEVVDLVAWRWHVPAEAREHLEAFNRRYRIGQPGSSIRCWMAWRQGRPIAKVLLHLAAGAAGLHGVATRPEARGLGLATTLTLTAFQAAREAGYELGILHSTPMAERLYARLGFRTVAPFKVFASGGFKL